MMKEPFIVDDVDVLFVVDDVDVLMIRWCQWSCLWEQMIW